MQSLIIAFAMYSKIPMPEVEWTEKNMRYAFCWFPLIGLVIGMAEAAVFQLLLFFQAGPLLKGAFLTAVPLMITGGIHLDGFMDTTDARSSYGDREKKLAILKDSHVGAFAVIGCGLYLLISAGAWSEMDWQGMKVMIFVFVLERALSGLAAVNFKGARSDGMLTAFREPAGKKMVTAVLTVTIIVSAAVMAVCWPLGAVISMAAALLVFGGYYRMAMKEFGGNTGDLAGWFLQTSEVFILLVLVVVGYIARL
ncbi:MAG: adenosylcobinamide-GDP ribazoletransferase [Coprococcus sp.]